MSAIFKFLAAHPKIVSIAFICGTVSLIIRVLDERLSEDKKLRFGKFVNRLAPRLAFLDLDAMLDWATAKPYQYLVLAIFSPLLAAAISLMFTKDEGVRADVFIAAGTSAVCGGLLCLSNKGRGKALGVAIRSAWGYAPFVYGILFLFERGVYLWLAAGDYSLESLRKDVYDNFHPIGLILLVTFLSILPTHVLPLLRPAVALTARGIWWLGTYPKGAWAGVVWVLTLALGILRLFM